MSKIMKDVQGIVVGIGIVGVIMVLLTIILLQTKNISGVNSATNTTIDNIITAIQSPVTYFSLIVLVVVFAFLLGFLIKKLSGAGGSE